jgi:hypothetical protein
VPGLVQIAVTGRTYLAARKASDADRGSNLLLDRPTRKRAGTAGAVVAKRLWIRELARRS